MTYYEMAITDHDHLVGGACGTILDVPRDTHIVPRPSKGIGAADELTIVYRCTCAPCLDGNAR